MEFAASIITAIDFGIKTSKFIHSVIHDVKDGPTNVQHAATAVSGLQLTLEQLSKCPALRQSRSEALKTRLLNCGDDLTAFDRKLKALTIEDSEKRSRRYWKRLRCAYNEKALDKIAAIVMGHTAALNLHLAALQR